jgi:hypothetical protein
MGDTLLLQFDVEYDGALRSADLRFSIIISTITGIPVLHLSNEDDRFILPELERAGVVVRVPELWLFPGTYTVSFWVGSPHYDDHDYVRDCLRFEVVQGPVPARAYRMTWHNGLVYQASQWSAAAPAEAAGEQAPAEVAGEQRDPAVAW